MANLHQERSSDSYSQALRGQALDNVFFFKGVGLWVCSPGLRPMREPDPSEQLLQSLLFLHLRGRRARDALAKTCP